MFLRAAAAARLTAGALATCSYSTTAAGGGRGREVSRVAASAWTARIGTPPAPAARSLVGTLVPRLWAGLSTSAARQV